MKKCMYLAMIATMVLFSCKPVPSPTPIDPLLEPGSDSSPDWKYEQSWETYGSMDAFVSVPFLFADYVSAADKMAVFGPNGKVLSAESPMKSDNRMYWLIIKEPVGGDGTALTVKWYCDKLHRIYEAKSFPNFENDAKIGIPDPFTPEFK